MQIKIVILAILVIISVNSCEKTDVNEERSKCVYIKDRTECEQNEYCDMYGVSFYVLDNRGYTVWDTSFPTNLTDPDDYHDNHSKYVCLPAITTHPSDTCPSKMYKHLSKNIIMVTNYSRMSEESTDSMRYNGWENTSQCDGGHVLVDYFFSGDGIISGSEECDASLLGTMESCAEFSDISGAGNFTGGNITCKDSLWDFSNCTKDGTGGGAR